MPALTAQELQNISNSLLDFYIKGEEMVQNIQEKPLFDMLRKKQKTFTPGLGNIKFNISGDRTSSFQGYVGSDTVSYVTPANNKQCSYAAHKNLHSGLVFTHDDFRRNGISIVEDEGGATSEKKHSERDTTIITDYIMSAIRDQQNGTAESFNSILWADGSASAKNPAGILSILTDTNNSGVIGGIDSATNSWWRHRTTLLGSGKVTASASASTLILALQQEFLQLRRYGGKPTLLLAGSGFLNALRIELNGKSYFTQNGMNKEMSIQMGDIVCDLGTFKYDPTLDDLGYSKRCYAIDTNHLFLYTMDGEDMVRRSPQRPADKYVVYKAVTWSGADIVCRKRNAHAIWEVA